MILRPNREKRGPDPHLDAKITIFGIAAVIALAGIITGRSWLIWIAIALLGMTLLLRFAK